MLLFERQTKWLNNGYCAFVIRCDWQFRVKLLKLINLGIVNYYIFVVNVVKNDISRQ